MRICWIIVALVLLSASPAAAQQEKKPAWSVKIAPFSLIDPILPSAHLAVERRVGKKAAVQLEGGPLLSFSAFSRSYYEPRGFRLRPSVRFYGFANSHDAYTEIMFVARIANMNADADVLLEASSGASYYQRLSYGINAQKFALLFNVGGSIQVGGGFLVEFAVGSGVSLRMYDISGIPENGTIRSTGIFNSWRPGGIKERWLPEISAYFNFGKVVTYLPAD